ncbi:MAG: hypothetical protein ABJL67_15615, partial [Sulfitobacter sp.]
IFPHNFPLNLVCTLSITSYTPDIDTRCRLVHKGVADSMNEYHEHLPIAKSKLMRSYKYRADVATTFGPSPLTKTSADDERRSEPKDFINIFLKSILRLLSIH